MEWVRTLGVAAAVVAMLASAPASAEQPASTQKNVQAAPPASPRALELSARFMAVTRMADTIDQMMVALMPILVESETRRYPEISDKDKETLVAVVREAFQEITPRYLDALGPELAKIYTEDELEMIVAFFESPGGRAYLDKQIALAPAAQRAMRTLEPELQEAVREGVCQRLGCQGQTPRANPS